MKRIFLSAILILLLGFNIKSFAWFDTGHMVIASIAWDQLTDEEKERLSYLINVLSDADPDFTDFVQAATWMDGIKGTGLYLFNHHHYISQYNMEYSPKQMPKFEDINLVWSINQSIRTLKNKKASDFAQALTLRMLIHMVADVHQPMHTASQVTKEVPGGDLGGNRFKLEGLEYGTYMGKPSFLNNLHKLWDSGVNFYAPMQADEYDARRDEFDKNKQDILDYINSLDEEKKANINFRIDSIQKPGAWAGESFQIAVKYAYQDIEPNTLPSEEYIARGQKISMEQSYIAAMRLAAVLRGALNQSK